MRSKRNLAQMQASQIEYQIQRQNHTFSMIVSCDVCRELQATYNILVLPGVLRPDISDSLFVARYLYYNAARLCLGKRVIDVGCGSGIFGIVMSKAGASRVEMTDISRTAIMNATQNVKMHTLDNVGIHLGSLLSPVSGKFDLIVFSHPFFSARSIPDDPIMASMASTGTLLRDFLRQSRNRLNSGGTIICCSFDFVDPSHDPVVQGAKGGFDVKTSFEYSGDLGAVHGRFRIFELTACP